VLLYLADPAAALPRVLRSLRGNGVAAFYDVNLAPGVSSFPVSPLHQLVGRCVSETFTRRGESGDGLETRSGPSGRGCLTASRLLSEALIGGGSEWMELCAPYAANALRSLIPMILEYGIATEEEIDIDTFEQRYRAEVLRQRSVVQCWSCVGAWARETSP